MTTFSSSGNTLWSFNSYISKQAFDNSTNVQANFISSTNPGIIEVYDRNRTLKFRREDMPRIYSEEHSVFLPFSDDGFAHLYRDSGEQTLFLRIYDKYGNPLNQPQSLPQRVDAFDAAVTTEEPLRIMVAVARIVPVTKVADINIYQFNRTGALLSPPSLLASGFLAEQLIDKVVNNTEPFQPTISASVAADGSFMVSWSSKTSDNISLIRTAYIKDGKPPAKAFIVANSQVPGFLMIVKCDAIKAGDGHFCVYDEFSPTAINQTTWKRTTYITQFSYSGSQFTLPTKLSETEQDTSETLSLPLVYGLPYGGLVSLSSISATPVRLYDRWWNSAPFTDPNIKMRGATVLPNNTILTLDEQGTINPGDWVIQGYKVFSADLPTFLNRSQYDNNPNIINAAPALGSTIDLNRSDFKVYFLDSNYTIGFGKISIYSINYQQYPREIINVQMNMTSMDSYSFAASSWTFNSPSSAYYITIDGGTFKSAIGEPLPGIGPQVWTLLTKGDSNHDERDEKRRHQLWLVSGAS
ncbi:hypothetical protein K7432_013689 [Basidiobolus ranarum]|uniref:Uncharacterized protein n=1 Tax=Basidiobolus ranarum TaxID=34480 RepID=A0ABR2WIT8_9FUNG